MITYIPAYVAARHRSVCAYDSKQPRHLLPLWEHFARLAIDWDKNALECLNDTSSIHNWEFQEFTSKQRVRDSLSRLFLLAGTDSVSGEFLRYCGIRKWSDLTKPIRVKGWDRHIPFDVDVRERKMKQPGPNECHPDAIFGQYAGLAFGTDRRWYFRVHYGYSHDSSSWYVYIRQNGGESLFHFGQRITAFVADLFESDDWPSSRQQANRDYDCTFKAVEDLFYIDHPDARDRLVRLLAGIKGFSLTAHRIQLTARRLATLSRWITEDDKETCKR